MKDETDKADPFATRLIPDAPARSAQEVEHATAHFHSGSGSGRLEVRCPNCHLPTDVAVDTALTDLTCDSCGSQFSLVNEHEASRQAPSLAKMGRFELVARGA